MLPTESRKHTHVSTNLFRQTRFVYQHQLVDKDPIENRQSLIWNYIYNTSIMQYIVNLLDKYAYSCFVKIQSINLFVHIHSH